MTTADRLRRKALRYELQARHHGELEGTENAHSALVFSAVAIALREIAEAESSEERLLLEPARG